MPFAPARHPNVTEKLASQPPFVAWALVWGLGLVIPIVAIAIDVLMASQSHLLGRDFSNAWAGGRLVLAGRPLCAFDPGCFRGALSVLLDLRTNQNFSYPPHALLIDAPLGLIPYFEALLLWTVAGLIAFSSAARGYLPAGFNRWLPTLTPAAGMAIWDGQYSLIIGALWLFCFAAIDQRPVRAGLAAGLMTVKPHLGLLVALALLWRGHWRVIGIASATTAALVVASIAAFGFESWRAFFAQTTNLQIKMLSLSSTDFYGRMMPSPLPLLGIGAHAVFTIAALSCLWIVRRSPVADLAFPCATATFLVLPYAFNYDMTVACLGFAIILYRHWQELGTPRRLLLILAFNAPQLTFLVPQSVPFILAGGLFIQCRLLVASGFTSTTHPTNVS
jgi:alpha-1,2-mannosyltransferase